MQARLNVSLNRKCLVPNRQSFRPTVPAGLNGVRQISAENRGVGTEDDAVRAGRDCDDTVQSRRRRCLAGDAVAGRFDMARHDGGWREAQQV
jgi:hypothetical protein